jgi:RNA polymerase sigma-70 factor (ECF subfamily)
VTEHDSRESLPLRDATAIVIDHSAFVWRVLLHLGVPDSQLEDASQEVFLVVLRQIERFEGRSSLRTWLFGICRNVAATIRRRARQHTELTPEELPDAVVQPAQEGELWIKRAHEQLVRALGELDEEQQTVFVLYEIEELSMEEIAQSHGVPITTLYSRLHAARKKIQAKLRRASIAGARGKVAR